MPWIYYENYNSGVTLGYSLAFFNIDGHTEETAWSDIVRRLLALAELGSLFSGQYLFQLAKGNIYSSSQP